MVFWIPICVVFELWCLLLLPRLKHGGWKKISAFRYAHRGLHNIERGIPENSLAAFRRAAEKGFGAELDVHLMADGQLAVVHDSNLSRVCGKEAVIEELCREELAEYPLLGSGERIPLLEEVLAVFEKKAPLIIELKVENGNAASLTDAVMARLSGWKGKYCIESFHPGVVRHLRKHYPSVIRGQLGENFLRRKGEVSPPWHRRVILTFLLTSFFTRPDFIAYRYTDRDCVSLRLMRWLYNVHEVGWTIRDKETMEELEAQGVVPIFEGFEAG